jgi:ATP-dependent protease ClpP protease subunit
MTIKQMPMQLLTSSDQQSAHLSIMGDITSWPWGDEDTSAMNVSKALADLPSTVGEIFVHINSYGGEVAEGVAIYNALKGHSAHVTTVCEGFACSIASVIFMAGDDRVMRPASLLMLHNASMFSAGDANAHRKVAEDLDVITELSKTAYLSHATEALTPEKLTEIMDAETWVTPAQAIEWGLATETEEPDEDESATQSARNLVMRSLTNPLACVKFMPATELKADVVPTRVNPLDQINERLEKVEQLFTRMDELEALIAKQEVTETPIIVDEVDEDAKRTYSERLAQIFKQLASNK